MKNVLALQRLSSTAYSKKPGNGNGSRLSVTGCPGKSTLSLFTRN